MSLFLEENFSAMRKFLFILLPLLIVSCKSRQLTKDTSNKYIIENLAQVNSAEELERIYPEASIEEGIDAFDEGVVRRPYSILYPGTQDEILLTWNDPERTKLHQIRTEKDGRWKTSHGIEVGTSYDELVEINGPIAFYGFGWDYSGAVDWQNGKLSDTNIRVFLAPKNTPPGKFYGDRIIKASEEEIEALGLNVQAILFQKDEE